MKHIDDMDIGIFAGQMFEIQRMLRAGQLDFELVKFQLGRLTQGSKQGIIAQLPTSRKVRAPGSLLPTIKRLRSSEWLDSKIPEEVLEHAIESCAQVPAGTMLDVVKVYLWMIGDSFEDSNAVFHGARAKGLVYEHNSWLPLVITDQFQDPNAGNLNFMLKKFGRYDCWDLVSSPGSSIRVRMEYRDRYQFSGWSYWFVREQSVPVHA